MIRVFPRKTRWTPTDALAFVGRPTLDRIASLPELPVLVSAAFSWDREEAHRLGREWSAFFSDVKVGGPAFGDPGGVFVPGRFIKEGVTITSRGCPKRCPWCFAWRREGDVRELPIADGWIEQSNNLLACSRQHVEGVFEMLSRQTNPVVISGGLDIDFLQAWHRPLIDSIRYEELFFACDSPRALPKLEKAAELLEGIGRKKKRCYVMIGFEGETIEEAERRLTRVFELGFLPFSQLYQGEDKKAYPREWVDLNKIFSRPAATKAYLKSKGFCTYSGSTTIDEMKRRI